MLYTDANLADLSDWDYPDTWLEEPEDFEEEDGEDYLNYAEDALMESYLFGDC
jgi:hypothetical protein